MSINAVNGLYGANAYLNISAIPQYLKSQMEELGIDPSKAANSSDAKKLIEEQKNKQAQQTEDEKDTSGKHNFIRDRILAIAAKLGLTFDDDESPEEMVAQIQSFIEHLSEQAAKRGNMELVNFLKSCQMELDSVVSSMKGADISHTQIYNYLELLAEQNKQSLGLSDKQ